MTNTRPPQEDKKIYTKPVVTDVPLVAEEAVLGFCKLSAGVQSTCIDNPTCNDLGGS